MKILITGAGGMVGRAFAAHCQQTGDGVFAFDRAHLDITDAKSINAQFHALKPDAIINCAAWTDVDACETNIERAFAVNARAVELLAQAARSIDAAFVTISTDYVFDGAKDGFYTQRDTPAPQSVYARAKLEGERRAQIAYARTIIVRTGWIFGSEGRNFLARIFDYLHRAAENGEPLKAISDARGTPTYARDLAARLRELAALDLPGIYHVTGSAMATYETFAREAARLCDLTERVRIESVSAASLKRPAPRPRNSSLRCLLSEAVGLAPLPAWQTALREFALKRE
jgi:dTDP-4-dehydrorhamnose reductase